MSLSQLNPGYDGQPPSSRLTIANDHVVVLAAAAAAIMAFAWLYLHGINALVEDWAREEYSHGPIIPIIALFLIVRQLADTKPNVPKGQWWAIPFGLLGVVLGALGTLSNIADLTQYGLVIAFAAIVIAALGIKQTVLLWAPLIYLGFMIPLPQMIYLKLFAWAQLISSEFGTLFIRLIGIPVFLEGNIIDLGSYKLQVVEACAGLRYLFPLMSFGYLFAVVYQGAKWARVIIFLSTIPISISMNSLRIGVVGVLVNSFGVEQAEGFIHLSEGWVVFVACIAILYAEASVLTYFGQSKRAAWASLDLRFDRISKGFHAFRAIRDWRPLAALASLFLIGVVSIGLLQNEQTAFPKRSPFAIFPTTLGEWSGKQSTLPPNIEDVLAADDYLLADYVSNKSGKQVNLFVSYYQTQNKGESPHSPEVCIPGAGWEISSLKTASVSLSGGGAPSGADVVQVNLGGASSIKINRATIQKGESHQLVYYWFKERGRIVANEYAAKWFIFKDGIVRNRTDGGMIRLITRINKTEGVQAADLVLANMLRKIYPLMDQYFPN